MLKTIAPATVIAQLVKIAIVIASAEIIALAVKNAAVSVAAVVKIVLANNLKSVILGRSFFWMFFNNSFLNLEK